MTHNTAPHPTTCATRATSTGMAQVAQLSPPSATCATRANPQNVAQVAQVAREIRGQADPDHRPAPRAEDRKRRGSTRQAHHALPSAPSHTHTDASKDSHTMIPITDPTALDDQFDAATRDARTHLADLAAVTGGPVTHTRAPAWLSDHLRALRKALHHDQARFCPHLLGGPGVAYAAVWAPGLLACPACAPALLQPSPTEDLRCDACHHTGPDGGHLHPGLIASGPILMAYGLCTDCRHLADPTPTRRDRRGRRCRRRGADDPE